MDNLKLTRREWREVIGVLVLLPTAMVVGLILLRYLSVFMKWIF